MDQEKGNAPEGKSVIEIILFAITALLVMGLAIAIGTKDNILSFAGAFIGAIASAGGGAAAHFILRKAFPFSGKRKALSYVSGIITLLLGAGAFFILKFFLGEVTLLASILYITTGIIFILITLLRGMDTATFPQALLGAVLSGAIFFGLTFIAKPLFESPAGAGAAMVFGLIVAFLGFAAAAIFRGSRFALILKQSEE